MNRFEFEMLRNVPDKTINGNLVFAVKKDSGSSNLVFDNIKVENSLNYELFLNATYKPDIPSVTFNFIIKNVGPICRVCVNGMIHKNVGRTHKHDLQNDSDPRNNLPEAIARNDLSGRKPSEIWQIICVQANIVHNGSLIFPLTEETLP